MPVKRISPDEAARLVQEGWIYIDVRSVPEFEQGHPSGAYNIPFMHKTAQGMTPNPEFAQVVEANFGKDDPLVVGCHSGRRSLRAATALEAQGYGQMVEMRGGMAGESERSGAVTFDGWVARGLPVANSAEPGRSYAELSASSR